MIPYVVQKKRVVVMDGDITIQEEVWRNIMRHVLGRHFDNLRGKGPGWSFSHTHLDTFSNMVEKLQEESLETSSSKSQEEECSEVGTQTTSGLEEECSEVGTQTSSGTEETTPHVYRFDVDDQVRSFVDNWCKRFQVVLKN